MMWSCTVLVFACAAAAVALAFDGQWFGSCGACVIGAGAVLLRAEVEEMTRGDR